MIQGKLIAQDFVEKTLTLKVKNLRKMLGMKKMILLEDRELLEFYEAMEREIKGKVITTPRAKKARELVFRKIVRHLTKKSFV